MVEPTDVAVDESSGDIYVADTGNHRIVKFDPSGHFLAAWGWGVSDGHAASEVCTLNCQAGSLVPAPANSAGLNSSQSTTPIACRRATFTSPTRPTTWYRSSNSAGELVTSWETNGARAYDERIEGIAVESNGNLIVRTGGGNGIAVDSFGNVLQGPVAIDLATNDRYVDTGELIHVLRANEELFEVFGFGDLRSAEGPVFDQSTRALYVANTGENDIAVFNPAATPEVKTGSATNLTMDSATITGYVDPSSAGSVSSCYFEYGTDTTYALGNVPCSPEAPLSAPTEVTAALTGLTPFTSYHYRLVTVSSDGTSYPTYGRDRTVTAIPGLTPTVGSTESSNITPTTASLAAESRS